MIIVKGDVAVEHVDVLLGQDRLMGMEEKTLIVEAWIIATTGSIVPDHVIGEVAAWVILAVQGLFVRVGMLFKLV